VAWLSVAEVTFETEASTFTPSMDSS